MSIKVFEPKSQYISQQFEILSAVKKVFNSSNYILGREVKKLEQKICNLLKIDYAISVKNGTDAIAISLKILNIGKGDEVITTSHTALATIAAILSVGATPVIAEIDKNYYTIDPKSINEKISKKTKAILPVHIYGQCCDMKSILNIARRNNIYVIEDCSQAMGAKIKGKYVGSFGDLGTISFYPTKILGAIGDGGIILTKNKNLAQKLIRYRQYGWDIKRSTKEFGINSRLDEVQAAILNVKMKNFKKAELKRLKIAKTYKQKIYNPLILLPKERSNAKHVFHIFSISVDNRKKFIKFLNKNKIFPGIHYNKLCHENKGYKKYCKFNNKQLDNSKKVSKRNVSLPIYPELSTKNIKKIIKVVNSYK